MCDIMNLTAQQARKITISQTAYTIKQLILLEASKGECRTAFVFVQDFPSIYYDIIQRWLERDGFKVRRCEKNPKIFGIEWV